MRGVIKIFIKVFIIGLVITGLFLIFLESRKRPVIKIDQEPFEVSSPLLEKGEKGEKTKKKTLNPDNYRITEFPDFILVE